MQALGAALVEWHAGVHGADIALRGLQDKVKGLQGELKDAKQSRDSIGRRRIVMGKFFVHVSSTHARMHWHVKMRACLHTHVN